MKSQPSSKSEGPFASLLTSHTRGAIAIVRVWGNGAIDVVNAVFRPRRGATFSATPSNWPRVGRVGKGAGDEVVVVKLDHTGQAAEAEIQCHGGPATVALVIEAILSEGARLRSPEKWIFAWSYCNFSALAQTDLANVETLRSARILLDQVNGALNREIEQLCDAALNSPFEAIERLRTLIQRAEVGLRLVRGWRISLAGRPNVGKSRLLNALAGYGRAIVSPTPGTTRDVVTIRTAIDGWPVEVADTAGLRTTAYPIEAAGVSLAHRYHVDADLIMLVLDRSESLTQADLSLLAAHPDALVVCNKSDLPAAWEPPPSWRDAQVISAEHGEGFLSLLQVISQRLVPNPPPCGSAVPFRPEQLQRLSQALELLLDERAESARHELTRLQQQGT